MRQSKTRNDLRSRFDFEQEFLNKLNVGVETHSSRETLNIDDDVFIHGNQDEVFFDF